MNRSKAALLLTAATLSLAYNYPATGETVSSNPYVAGDMHNHNTCTDGSTAAGYEIDRSVASGVAPAGGKNFELDWFTMGNHGGSGNRDCRFSDASANIPGDNTTTFWTDTLGQTIQGITINSLKGTSNPGRMWRWQSVAEVEYPLIVNRAAQYANRTLIEGLEWILPGHEHGDVAVITGQNPGSGGGDADKMAEFEFRFDRADADAIGPVDASSNPIWTGKDTVNNTGAAGHGKSIAAIQWLQANYALTSYAIPTHSERQGPFNPTGNKGYNIEHFRDFNNAGPTVAFGIESPGHFAEGGVSGGAGSYGSGSVGGGTYGMTGVYHAKVGGLWDGLLAEGRNMFMYVSSDWHNRGSFGARDSATTSDFWPGEYTKLYVPNAGGFNNQSVIDGMRSGNSYSVNGNLIRPNLEFRARAGNSGWKTMGETLVARPGQTVTLVIAMEVPPQNNSPYSFANPLLAQLGVRQPLNKPSLDHIDLIRSKITGVVDPSSPNYAVPNAGGVAGASIVYNPFATVMAQVQASSGMRRGRYPDGTRRYIYLTQFTMGSEPFYIRMRGTNMPVATPNVTDSAGNPLLDVNNALVDCADPACPAHMETVGGVKKVTNDVQAWSNLWFYTNPIFFRPVNSPKLLVQKNAELAASLKAAAPARQASR